MTQCNICGQPATKSDWYPTFPDAHFGPRPWCQRHFDSMRRLRDAQGWYANDEAVAQFQECEFIVRKTENDAYHKLLVVLLRHGSLVAGAELGQPIPPGSFGLYVYNELLWITQIDSITILGPYNVCIKRYARMAAEPKKLADRSLLAFF